MGRAGAAVATLFLVACAAAPRAASEDVALDDAAVRTRTHELLLAYDQGDTGRLQVDLATTFVHIDGGDSSTRADDLAAAAAQESPTISARTWSEEKVFASPGVRIFRGLADEAQAGNDVHGNYHFKGWYTIIWVREAGAWRAGMITWQAAGHEAENTWNAIYADHVGFTREPNHLLVTTVAGLPPGRALDVATGQGRNGLYLASLGWKVTGVDFAMEGLREAGEAAAARKLPYEPVYADLSTYDYGVEKWDLVAMIYTPDHPDWLERVKPSLVHGGLFVLEFFARGPESPSGTDLAALEQSFAGWQILRHEIVEDTPDWARNRARLVRFVARRP
jgi:SAM-dependent methyltransferase